MSLVAILRALAKLWEFLKLAGAFIAGALWQKKREEDADERGRKTAEENVQDAEEAEEEDSDRLDDFLTGKRDDLD